MFESFVSTCLDEPLLAIFLIPFTQPKYVFEEPFIYRIKNDQFYWALLLLLAQISPLYYSFSYENFGTWLSWHSFFQMCAQICNVDLGISCIEPSNSFWIIQWSFEAINPHMETYWKITACSCSHFLICSSLIRFGALENALGWEKVFLSLCIKTQFQKVGSCPNCLQLI